MRYSVYLCENLVTTVLLCIPKFTVLLITHNELMNLMNSNTWYRRKNIASNSTL
jgi:hypothetical protein